MKRVAPLLMLALLGTAHAERVLTPLEHRQSIVVKPNESIVIKLPANPSTGYVWFFEKPGNSAIKLVQDQRFTPWNKHVIGSPGDSIWRFSAQQSGEATLRFVYRKSWEGPDVEPLDVRSYKIVVDNQKKSQIELMPLSPYDEALLKS